MESRPKGEKAYSLSADAIRTQGAIPYNSHSELIPYQDRENPRSSTGSLWRTSSVLDKKSRSEERDFLVETTGLEPVTPCMSSKYSSLLSYASIATSIITLNLHKSKRKIKFFLFFIIFWLVQNGKA